MGEFVVGEILKGLINMIPNDLLIRKREHEHPQFGDCNATADANTSIDSNVTEAISSDSNITETALQLFNIISNFC